MSSGRRVVSTEIDIGICKILKCNVYYMNNGKTQEEKIRRIFNDTRK